MWDYTPTVDDRFQNPCYVVADDIVVEEVFA
jgi:hypothetical protein